jgi:hypothetical protein
MLEVIGGTILPNNVAEANHRPSVTNRTDAPGHLHQSCNNRRPYLVPNRSDPSDQGNIHPRSCLLDYAFVADGYRVSLTPNAGSDTDAARTRQFDRKRSQQV